MYCDPPHPDGWKYVKTWDETPVMPESCKPLSFYLNRPLARRFMPNLSWEAPLADREPIEPQSLPPVAYTPKPPPKPKDPLEAAGLLIMVDGRRHMMVNGQLMEVMHEHHPGPQSFRGRVFPVPGVSKKGRGRLPPTGKDPTRKGATYTCKVEGCRKTFGRHAHLKRHIESLHTHEEKYMCALPFCDKSFKRRDNLLQHERKHKHYQAFFDCTEKFEGELMPQYRPRDADPETLAELEKYKEAFKNLLEQAASGIPFSFPIQWDLYMPKPAEDDESDGDDAADGDATMSADGPASGGGSTSGGAVANGGATSSRDTTMVSSTSLASITSFAMSIAAGHHSFGTQPLSSSTSVWHI
ncbi:uncharacterized protein LAESUDRAFT_707909 [Laetiporus sulphureus 93-53]|uniref:C2H2-type domain-containing protein n=1 Tax=Laetiporus sulphureus 93-53 TaxID=1314785 RepID=A0A165BJL7_9APHY|nr:uncharacterized protein LAESUDRAFT_707909 [Laetiporus sulphureus 93-53]KZT01182.1 hypothetical protein LAESUDRAFT_707909 [Laetiporus sulphureus 93-53]